MTALIINAAGLGLMAAIIWWFRLYPGESQVKPSAGEQINPTTDSNIK